MAISQGIQDMELSAICYRLMKHKNADSLLSDDAAALAMEVIRRAKAAFGIRDEVWRQITVDVDAVLMAYIKYERAAQLDMICTLTQAVQRINVAVTNLHNSMHNANAAVMSLAGRDVAEVRHE